MTDSEKTASRSAFGWLPKLILWGVVIAFGYLYLNSIDQGRMVRPHPCWIKSVS